MLKTRKGACGVGSKTPPAPHGTVPRYLWPLMELRSTKSDRCEVCGRRSPLNQHHIVFRSQGKLYDADGNEIPKPTITLCGFGNNLRDVDGRFFCHGMAHHHMLHFRNNGGHREYLITDKPINEWDALKLDGWSEC